MKLKIASYNISGGIHQKDDSVDYLDKKQAEDIDTRLLNSVVDTIDQERLDIICFQEIITTDRINYIPRIINKTNLKYVETFELSPCNLVRDTDCGLAILSKYPIKNSTKKLFTNPKLSKTTNSGNTYYTFDKGILFSEIQINNTKLSVLTHHGFPFGRFNSTPEDNPAVFAEFDGFIKDLSPDIITGDFNSENYLEMMPYTNEHYLKTINEPTKDDGARLDNILVPNSTNYTTKVIKNPLSDHFIIITEINLSE